MGGHSIEIAAERAGVEPSEMVRLTELGILGSDADGGYSDADVRRVQVVQALERSGLPVEGLARLLREGGLSLAVPGRGRRQRLRGPQRHHLRRAQRAHRHPGRDAHGPPRRDGWQDGCARRPRARGRAGDPAARRSISSSSASGSRRSNERSGCTATACGGWRRRRRNGGAPRSRSPCSPEGGPPDEIGRRAAEISPRLSQASDRALVAIYHAQQMHVWSANIVDGIAAALEQAGLHTREERHPAMCFLDLTGFTQLTQERGDAAAAQAGRALEPDRAADLGAARWAAGQVAG